MVLPENLMVTAKANVCNVAYMDLLKCGRSETSSLSFRTFLVKRKVALF